MMKTCYKILAVQLVLLTLATACSKDNDSINKAPVAVAGEDGKVEIGATAHLNAGGSTDPDGDELTYHWAFTTKPEGSIAAIMGEGNKTAEFNVDKAGTYEVELKVNDGTLEATDRLVIQTETLVLKDVRTNTITGLDDDLVHKGGTISIYGDHFSPDIDDMSLTVGGVPYEITDLTSIGEDLDLLTVTVPDDAVSGELVITQGPDSTTWTLPIRITIFPVAAFVEANGHLEEQVRIPAGRGSFEIGTRFQPLVNGHVVGVTLRVPENNRSNPYEVTLWDDSTMEPIHSEMIAAPDLAAEDTEHKVFSAPVQVEASKTYIVSFYGGYWFNHIDEQDSQADQFPQDIDNTVRLLSTAYYPGIKIFPDEGFPVNYITKGADIIFAADVE
jgi:hypothetical protein